MRFRAHKGIMAGQCRALRFDLHDLKRGFHTLRKSHGCMYFMEVTPPQRKIAAIVPKLLEWYSKNARDLPWRRDPYKSDPYCVYVSEVMLQQTQVKTVLPFWKRWMHELPTIRSLARARPDKLHKLWEGLGYYTRVRSLGKAARVIVKSHGGRFPTRYEDVLELPGIGPYTAGAICSIAFNQPRPILDGNVIRVLTRLCGIDGDPRNRKVNARLWEIAERLVRHAAGPAAVPNSKGSANGAGTLRSGASERLSESSRCSQLNQGLMELGALVCTPRAPRCDPCPLSKVCVAQRQGLVAVLPRTAPRRVVTRRRFVAWVARRKGKVLVRQRPAGVVNAHLWEFPNIEVPVQDGDPVRACREGLGLDISEPIYLRSVHHSITHYRIRLDVFQIPARDLGRLKVNTGRWVEETRAHRLAFSSAHKKILAGLAGPSSLD